MNRFGIDRPAGKDGHLAIAPARPGEAIRHVPVTIRRLGHDTRGVTAGIAFAGGETEATRIVADLMYAQAATLDDFRARRGKSVGVLVGSADILQMSVRHMLRGLAYLARAGQPHSSPRPAITVTSGFFTPRPASSPRALPATSNAEAPPPMTSTCTGSPASARDSMARRAASRFSMGLTG